MPLCGKQAAAPAPGKWIEKKGRRIRMKRKRVLAWILTCAMLLTMLPLAGAVSFRDTQGHWAQDVIDKWSGYGVIQGYDNNFEPDAPITRGDMAVIIDRIMDYQEEAENTFSDLGTAYYTDAVLRVAAAGVMEGYNGQVRPDDPITREEAVCVLARALSVAGGSGSAGFYLASDQKAGRTDLRWGVTEAPCWPESGEDGETQIFSGMSICKNSDNIELAWEFIQFASGEEGARIMAEEQMQPAYMDETVEQTYRENFTGEYLDPAILERAAYTRGGMRKQDDSAQQEVLCNGFRKCMVGEWTVDEALANMQAGLEALAAAEAAG